MDVDLTVVCMLWGDWCEPHGIKYVKKLRNMVSRHLDLPYNMVCFTDRHVDVKDVDIRIMPYNITQWDRRLPKFYMHSFDAGLKGRILYLDLDIVIIDSLNDFASYDGCFAGVKKYAKRGMPHIDGTILAFEAGTTQYLWDIVSNNPDYFANGKYKGNERRVLIKFVKDFDYWQDILPGQLVSYKWHCTREVPEGARLIAFHGKPRTHEVRDKFVKENWK